MILEHYSAKPLDDVQPVAQHSLPDHKPQGLWLSVLGPQDWPTWCRENDWQPKALKHCARFTLAPGANVLHVKGPAAIDAFHAEFGVQSSAIVPDFHEIAWAAVAAQYDGIIIAPYCWARRLHQPTSWYYGWDCASACIWQPRAIERVDAI